MNLETEIKQIIANIIQIPVETIDSSASFFDEYGMDSLRVLEILAEVENTYHITIDPDHLMKMTSVDEVVRITQETIQANG